MTEEQREQLFNGNDMAGWEMVGRGGFRVDDGLLVTEGGMGLLWNTTQKIGNAALRVVYKVSRPEDNSGVFVRIGERPENVWYPIHHGYEVQIMDPDDEYHRTGCIYSLTKAPAGVQKPPGEWNQLEITMRGLLIDVELNGTPMTHFDPDAKLREREFDYEPERGPREEYGYIGLQNHDHDSVVAFKEVSVVPLS